MTENRESCKEIIVLVSLESSPASIPQLKDIELLTKTHTGLQQGPKSKASKIEMAVPEYLDSELWQGSSSNALKIEMGDLEELIADPKRSGTKVLPLMLRTDGDLGSYFGAHNVEKMQMN